MHHRSTNFVKAKRWKRNWNFEKFQNAVNLIYTVCSILEMMIETMFAIVSIMRITGVDISNQPKCENKHQFRKVWRHCKSNLHSVSNVGNDDLNNVHHSFHGAYHRSRNFVKAKMCKTNSNFKSLKFQMKFQITVNLIYTVCALSEMMI